MRKVKQINIKNRTYYFYNDMININPANISLDEDVFRLRLQKTS